MRGFLVLDKPAGPSSHDLVGILRSLTGVRRIGHTGTLDPFATGVLPLAIGGVTRLIQYLDEEHKVYQAELVLGTATETGDPEGEVVETGPEVSLAQVDAVLQGFVGEITQRPPPYSAVKHKGRPLYAYAREGTLIHGEPRQIRVHSLRRLPEAPGPAGGPQVLRFEVACSRGTYVRVLGVDIAKALGTVGHLRALRRLASGPFKIEQSVDLPTLAQWACGTGDWATAFSRDREVRLAREPRETWIHQLEPKLQPPETIFASWPAKTCSEREARRTLQGVCPAPPPGVELGDRYRVMHQERLLALAHVLPRGPRLLRVLQP